MFLVDFTFIPIPCPYTAAATHHVDESRRRRRTRNMDESAFLKTEILLLAIFEV